MTKRHTNQSDLFHNPPALPPHDPMMVPMLGAVARRSDPATSHQAAQTINRSGKADTHNWLIMAFVIQHPGQTAAEIGAETWLGHHEAQRRLSDLSSERGGYRLGKGPVRKCSINGTPMVTWYRKGDAP